LLCGQVTVKPCSRAWAPVSPTVATSGEVKTAAHHQHSTRHALHLQGVVAADDMPMFHGQRRDVEGARSRSDDAPVPRHLLHRAVRAVHTQQTCAHDLAPVAQERDLAVPLYFFSSGFMLFKDMVKVLAGRMVLTTFFIAFIAIPYWKLVL
jgi:hypothetical protein